MKLATIAGKAASLSEAIFRYWDTELRKRHPDYPLVNPGEDDGPPPPQQKKLRELLTSLPEETLYKLALIKYVGDGRCRTSDLRGGYQDLRDYWDNPAELVEMMVETPLDYSLAEGMTRLTKAGIDLDKMDFTATRAGKNRRIVSSSGLRTWGDGQKKGVSHCRQMPSRSTLKIFWRTRWTWMMPIYN